MDFTQALPGMGRLDMLVVRSLDSRFLEDGELGSFQKSSKTAGVTPSDTMSPWTHLRHFNMVSVPGRGQGKTHAAGQHDLTPKSMAFLPWTLKVNLQIIHRSTIAGALEGVSLSAILGWRCPIWHLGWNIKPSPWSRVCAGAWSLWGPLRSSRNCCKAIAWTCPNLARWGQNSTQPRKAWEPSPAGIHDQKAGTLLLGKLAKHSATFVTQFIR